MNWHFCKINESKHIFYHFIHWWFGMVGMVFVGFKWYWSQHKTKCKTLPKNILFHELFVIVQNLIKILLKLKWIGNQVLNLYCFQTIYCLFFCWKIWILIDSNKFIGNISSHQNPYKNPNACDAILLSKLAYTSICYLHAAANASVC